jgi:hypothetical protein
MVWAAAFRRPRRCAGRRASWIGGPRNDVIATAEHGIQRICDTHHLAFSSWVPAACPCGELQQGPASQDLGDRADTLAPVGDAALDALPAPVALHQVRREGTRDAPCLERIRRAHQLEVQVRAVEFPVWPTRPSTSPARTCWPPVTATLPGARCAYSAYEPPAPTITWLPASRTGSSPRRANANVLCSAQPGLPHDVQPLALGHPVHGLDDHAVEGRKDRLPPSVAVPRPPPNQQPAQGPRGVQVKPGTVVGADQVIGVALAEQVGAVARDPGRRGPLDRPLASKGKLDHDRVIELSHRRQPNTPQRLLPCVHPTVFRYHTRVLTRRRAEAPSRMTAPRQWSSTGAKLPSVPGSRTGH